MASAHGVYTGRILLKPGSVACLILCKARNDIDRVAFTVSIMQMAYKIKDLYTPNALVVR